MQQTLQTFYQNLDQYYAAGDVDQMERFLLETEAQYRKNTAGAAEIGIAVYNELGSLYRGISRYDASISSFQHARQLVEKEIGTDSVQYATVLNNMAGTYRQMRDHDRAIELFQTARKLYHERTTRLIKTVLTCSVRGVHYMMTIGYKTTKELHILRN